jgi:hypothetical protein
MRVRWDIKRIQWSNEKRQVQIVCVKRIYNFIFSRVRLEEIREKGWLSISGNAGVNICRCHFYRIKRIFLTSGLQYKIQCRFVWRHNMNPHAYFVYRNILSVKITRTSIFKSIWQNIHTTTTFGKYRTIENGKIICLMANLKFPLVLVERRSI